MQERLKELRKALGMTQDKFGEKLGVSKSAIQAYEYGRRELTERMKKDICTKFNVRYAWLECGEGEMFEDDGDAKKIIENKLQNATDEEKDIFMELAKLDTKYLRAINAMIKELNKDE